MITEEDLKTYKIRRDKLKTDRHHFEETWQDCADYISPRKADFLTTQMPGERKRTLIFDGIGEQANTLLVAGLHGMLTNPSTRWFALQSTDDDINEVPAVKGWLRDVELAIWNRLYAPGSNFAVALNECYEDLGAFGTHVLYMSGDDDGELLFQPQHLASTLIDTNAKGFVDTVFRKPDFTVRTLVETWGVDGVSDRIREKYADQKYWNESVDVCHVVAPRKQYDSGKKDPGNMPWLSCYFEVESLHKLEEGGYPDFPFAVPRWSKRSNEVYGRCPGMVALSDIKMINAMMRTTLEAGQLAARPPLMVPDDGYLGPLRMVPGGVNYYRGQPNGVYAVPTSSALPFTLEWIEQLRDKVRNAFHADILQLVTEREMTLGEAQMRFSERMRLLGPVHGRLDNELLSRIIEWTYGRLERAKLLPPAPEELDLAKLRIEYVSPISIAQRQTEAQGFVQMLQTISPVLQDPTGEALSAFKETISLERLFTWMHGLFKVNPDILTTDEERQAKAQQAQQMQAMQMAGPAAQAAQQGTAAVKNLSDAQASGGMDLGQLMGMIGQSANDGTGDEMAQQLMAGE